MGLDGSRRRVLRLLRGQDLGRTSSRANRTLARARTQPDSALRIGCFAAFGQAKGEVEEEDSMGTCMDNVKIDRDVP